eukprot:COSAG04_NODE_25958_length_301_cov_0.935644_1_plen_100_part_11
MAELALKPGTPHACRAGCWLVLGATVVPSIQVSAFTNGLTHRMCLGQGRGWRTGAMCSGSSPPGCEGAVVCLRKACCSLWRGTRHHAVLPSALRPCRHTH